MALMASQAYEIHREQMKALTRIADELKRLNDREELPRTRPPVGRRPSLSAPAVEDYHGKAGGSE